MKSSLPLLGLGVLAVLPLLGLGSYTMHILILVIMWSVIGMAWNLLGGYCGQVSFGHAAFFGVGAYTAGLLYSKLGWSGWWGFPASLFVVAAFSLAIGFICLRLRGPYFALATLSMGVIFRITAENMVGFTGGDLGIMIRERTWVEKTGYYYIILAVAVATYWFIRKVVQSKPGYYFVAIREDQDAAESLGINTTLYKTVALVLSGVITGLAGVFYMNYMGYIDPKVVFALHDISIITIMVVMVGGVATFTGPIVGAVIMVLLDESFAGLNPVELDDSIGIIRRIRERGITIMIIEHHMKVIMSICDRIVAFCYGEKIAEGAPAEISRNRHVIEAYLGETDRA